MAAFTKGCHMSTITNEDIYQEFLTLVRSGADDEAITQAFGGGTVYVPSHKNTSYNARNVAILNDYKAGKTPRQIAAEYELSRSRVWAITKPVRDAQKEAGQGGL